MRVNAAGRSSTRVVQMSSSDSPKKRTVKSRPSHVEDDPVARGRRHGAEQDDRRDQPRDARDDRHGAAARRRPRRRAGRRAADDDGPAGHRERHDGRHRQDARSSSPARAGAAGRCPAPRGTRGRAAGGPPAARRNARRSAGQGLAVPSVTSTVRVHARPMSSRSCEMTTSVRPSAAAHVPEELEQPAAALPVEARERLVQDQYARPGRQQARDRDASHLAAAQLVDAAPGELRGQADPVQARRHERVGSRLARGQVRVESGGGEDVLGDGRPLQLQSRVLERQRHRADRLRRRARRRP